MAGNYPDVPGPRLAYERDGTVMFGIDSDTGSVTVMTGANMVTLNDEDTDSLTNDDFGGSSHGAGMGFIFPELRDINGYLFCTNGGGPMTGLQTTVDSTNGTDGTWTTQVAGSISWVAPGTAYRTGINSVSYNGIKGIRWNAGDFFDNRTFYFIHLYGKIAAGQTPDRLRLWHPTLDQPLDDQSVSPDGAYFDWGNVPRSSSADRTFRVKNNSATLTANNITISIDAPTDTTPSVPGQHLLSNDGVSFAATKTISALAPGAISAVHTLRRTTPANAILSLWVARILASAATWT